MIARAAENFELEYDRYFNSVQDVLEGNLREVIGQMELRKMVTTVKSLLQRCKTT